MATVENSRVDDAQIDETRRYFTSALVRIEQLARELEHEGVEPDVIDALRTGERHLAAVRRHLAGASVTLLEPD